jgi:hypothetical protein
MGIRKTAAAKFKTAFRFFKAVQFVSENNISFPAAALDNTVAGFIISFFNITDNRVSERVKRF